jgi:hypothetical protein
MRNDTMSQNLLRKRSRFVDNLITKRFTEQISRSNVAFLKLSEFINKYDHQLKFNVTKSFLKKYFKFSGLFQEGFHQKSLRKLALLLNEEQGTICTEFQNKIRKIILTWRRG